MPPNPFLKALKELTEFLGVKFDKLNKSIQSIEPGKATDLRPVALAINKLSAELKNNAATVDVQVDTSLLEKEVRAATSAVKALDTPDISGIEAILSRIATATADNAKGIATLSTHLKEGLSAIKLSVPDTFKLDDMQLRSIRSGGERMTMNSGLQTATRITAVNQTLTNANTQYSYTFPSGTLSWVIRARAVSVPVLYSWETDKLPTSGDGAKYFTIHANFLRSSSGVDYGGKTIYLQSGTAGAVLEIESHQL